MPLPNEDIYNALVAKCPTIERRGRSVPYTSANGYMFSLVNKEGEIGIRFGKERQEELFKIHNTGHLKSHGAVMKGYVRIPESLFGDLDLLAKYLIESHDYVMSLPSK